MEEQEEQQQDLNYRRQQQLLDELTDDLVEMQNERELVVDHKKGLKRAANSMLRVGSANNNRHLILTKKNKQQHVVAMQGYDKLIDSKNAVKLTALEHYFVEHEQHNNNFTNQQSNVVATYELQRQTQHKRQFLNVACNESNDAGVSNTGDVGDVSLHDNDDDEHALMNNFILKNDNSGHILITSCNNLHTDDEVEDDGCCGGNDDNNRPVGEQQHAEADDDNMPGAHVVGDVINDQTHAIDINNHLHLRQNVTYIDDDDVGDNVGVCNADDDMTSNSCDLMTATVDVDTNAAVSTNDSDVKDFLVNEEQHALTLHQGGFMQQQQHQTQQEHFHDLFAAEQHLNYKNILHKEEIQKQQQPKQQINMTSATTTMTTEATSSNVAQSAAAICVNNVECVEYLTDDLEDLKVMIVC